MSNSKLRALGLVTLLFVLTVALCALHPPPAQAKGGGVTPTATTTAGTQGISTQGGATTIYYTVQPGDTLYSIAQRYGVSAKDLQDWNNIADPKKLKVGQNLQILQGQDTSISSASRIDSTAASLPIPVSTIFAFAVGFIVLIGLFAIFDRRKK
ncbi:MAG: LysM peptidoglycan-binding domain-containing protein [Anaerolineae bacterium]|nr:LysM peptidoglycan-binding domain-containing protein [Anaerolineae bacterium]